MQITIKRIVLAAALLFTMSGANAAVLTWSLVGVTFDDGATATGSFNYEASTNTYSGVSISVSSGTFSAYTYQDGSIFIGQSSASMVDFVSSPIVNYLRLAFVTPLDDAGGTRNLLTSGQESFECDNCFTFRYITSGAVSASPVPVPAALWLLGSAVGVLLGIRRRVT